MCADERPACSPITELAVATDLEGTPQDSMTRVPSKEVPKSPPRRLMITASAVFALRFVALAAFSPYIFLWLESNGFDTHERGLLGALSSVSRLFSPMLLGSLADWSGRRRVVFVVATAINGATVAALTLAPRSSGAQAALLALCGLTETGSLIDAFVMRSLAWAGAVSAAPRARAWGAFTWCLCAPAFGALAEQFGISTLFMAYGMLQLAGVPICLMLPISQAYTIESLTTSAPTTSFAKRLHRALCSGSAGSRQLLFSMPVFVLVGLQLGIGFTFGFIYLKTGLLASGVLVGLSLTFQAAIEVPLFRVANSIIRSLGGIRPALLTTSLAASIRFLGWFLAPVAWVVLPFEVGHGWSFALAYTSMTLTADNFAADGLQATVVGVLSSCLQLGQLAATLGWGAVVEAAGLRNSFGAASALFGVTTLPLLLYLRTCIGEALARCGCCLSRKVDGNAHEGAGPWQELDELADDEASAAEAVSDEHAVAVSDKLAASATVDSPQR